MKEVRKKSIDPAVNHILKAAYRQQMPLVWDRAEAMQPQCSFGRLAICCTSCNQGPCRVNPFAEDEQETICGRGRHDLVAGFLVRKAADGALALAKLACEADSGTGAELVGNLTMVDDELIYGETAGECLHTVGKATTAALETLHKSREAATGAWQPAISEVNLGILQAGAVNIVFHGHVNAMVIAGIKAAAENLGTPVNLVAMCGNEWSGGFQLPALTNYVSQETPLLTGAVDLLVIGSQCVMPALVKLAECKNVPVARAGLLHGTEDYQAVVLKAQHAFSRRLGRATDIPAAKSQVYAGSTLKNSRALFQTLAQAYAAGTLKGVIYLGGCGNVANTQDAQPFKLAASLVAEGYFVITAGCAGIAVAKAGMCSPGWNNGDYPLKSVLPPDIPPVLNIGSCSGTGELLQIAAVLRQDNVPVFAVFPEVIHNKILATAIGFAAIGMDVWLGFEAIVADAAAAGWLNETLQLQAGGRVLPLADAAELLQSIAEANNRWQQGR